MSVFTSIVFALFRFQYHFLLLSLCAKQTPKPLSPVLFVEDKQRSVYIYIISAPTGDLVCHRRTRFLATVQLPALQLLNSLTFPPAFFPAIPPSSPLLQF